MVTVPVVVLAVMTCGEAGLRVTLTRVFPIEAWALTAYGTVPGTRSETGPAPKVAVRDSGGAEKVTSMRPADMLSVTRADDTSRPRIGRPGRWPRRARTANPDRCRPRWYGPSPARTGI